MSIKHKEKILAALDDLALALTEHGHKWTKKERRLYEAATSLLNLQ